MSHSSTSSQSLQHDFGIRRSPHHNSQVQVTATKGDHFMTHIKIVDRPCGYGKSTEILGSLNKKEKYLAVVPLLSEVSRFIEGARKSSEFRITEPVDTDSNKSDHAEKLIRDGKSLVCTQALFYQLGTIATQLHNKAVSAEFDGVNAPKIVTKCLLDDYNLIIDEVIAPFENVQTVNPLEFNMDYIELGMALIHKDGRVEPTAEWDKRYAEGNRTFDRRLYEKAKSGGLYKFSKGLFVLTVPFELLLRPKTVTIYTYLSEGSVLLHFLRKLKNENPDLFTLEIDRLDANAEKEWRQDVASNLTIKPMPGLEPFKWNHTAQLKELKKHQVCAKVGYELRKFRSEELVDVCLSNVMLTSARLIWFATKSGQKPEAGQIAKHCRMFGHPKQNKVCSAGNDKYKTEWSTTGVQFVPNQTRGTNAHIKCTHAIYLYDQNPNPQLLTFLGMKRDEQDALRFCDAYALTELVQWLFRSAIRAGGVNGTAMSGKPREQVTVYIPSERMRNLLINWLETGEVNSLPKDGMPPIRLAKTKKSSPRRKLAA
jgi:hypothetical protein